MEVEISSTTSAVTAASFIASNSSVFAAFKAQRRASKAQAKPDTRATPSIKLCRGIFREKINGGASHSVMPDTVRAEIFKSDITSPPHRLKPRLCWQSAEIGTATNRFSEWR